MTGDGLYLFLTASFAAHDMVVKAEMSFLNVIDFLFDDALRKSDYVK